MEEPTLKKALSMDCMRLKEGETLTRCTSMSCTSSTSSTSSSTMSLAPSVMPSVESMELGEAVVESSLPLSYGGHADKGGCHFFAASFTGSSKPGNRGFCAVIEGSARARMSPGMSHEASNLSRRRCHSATLNARKSSQPSCVAASSPFRQSMTLRDVWLRCPDMENVGGKRSHASQGEEDGEGHTRRISLQASSGSSLPSRIIAEPAKTETKAFLAWVDRTTTKGLPRGLAEGCATRLRMRLKPTTCPMCGGITVWYTDMS
mmetsp:Transcript_63371/g.163040  ORF Transcript_63371/g.163040 Transcript_63371/m.163040 type:complete len:262 (+) Transcript_63371:845-1630(+)